MCEAKWDEGEEVSWAEGKPFEDRDKVLQNPDKVPVGITELVLRSWAARRQIEWVN